MIGTFLKIFCHQPLDQCLNNGREEQVELEGLCHHETPLPAGGPLFPLVPARAHEHPLICDVSAKQYLALTAELPQHDQGRKTLRSSASEALFSRTFLRLAISSSGRIAFPLIFTCPIDVTARNS